MKRSKLPSNISLQYLINEVKKQEQKENKGKRIAYIDGDTNEILQLGGKDIYLFFLKKVRRVRHMVQRFKDIFITSKKNFYRYFLTHRPICLICLTFSFLPFTP